MPVLTYSTTWQLFAWWILASSPAAEPVRLAVMPTASDFAPQADLLAGGLSNLGGLTLDVTEATGIICMVWSGAVKAGAGQVAGKHVEFRTEAMVPVPIAGGYLLKERDTRRLVDAIREVADGGAVFDPEVTQRLAGNRSNRTPVAPLNPLGSLTAQELRLLAEVARGKTDKEVAVVIGLTHKTARNYLDRIFTKLGVHTRTEAAMLYARNRPDAGPR